MSTRETGASLPLAGWIFHTIVRAGFLLGAALAGWSLGDGGVAGALLAGLLIAAIGALWALTYAEADPERHSWGRIRVPGRLRLAIELTIVILGGAAIWIFWNRAAAETYLTLAVFDYSVQYRRIVALSRPD